MKSAVEKALALGCSDASAVQCLLTQTKAVAAPVQLSAEELGSLSRYDRPLPEMSGYDRLLNGERDSPTRLGGVQ